MLKKIQFKNVKIDEHFIHRNIRWKKLSKDTAIPDGYECSNSVHEEELVWVSRYRKKEESK